MSHGKATSTLRSAPSSSSWRASCLMPGGILYDLPTLSYSMHQAVVTASRLPDARSIGGTRYQSGVSA